jgi:hypothetical protein
MLDIDAHFREVRKSIDRGEGSGWSREGVRAQIALKAVALQKRRLDLSDGEAFDVALRLNPDLALAYRTSPSREIAALQRRQKLLKSRMIGYLAAKAADDERAEAEAHDAAIGVSKAYQSLETIAADIRKREPALSEAKAFAKAMSTPEGLRLYRQDREQRMFAGNACR